MAQLKKGNITIPLGGTLAEQIDERLLDKGAMAKAENVLFDKHGAVVKALGCEILSFAPERAGVLLEDGFALESIKDQDRELLLAGGYLKDASGYSYLDEYYQACVLDEQKDILRPRGFWPPISQKNWIAVYSEDDIRDPCIARLGGYLWHVWVEDAGATYNLYLTVIEEATGAVVLDHELLSAGARRPHIVPVGTGALHVYHTRAGNLWRSILDPTDPANPGATAQVYALNVAEKIFDICTLVDPTFSDVACAVFKDVAGNLRGVTWDAAGTVRRDVILALLAAFDPIEAVACARVEDKTSGALGHFMAYAFRNNLAPAGLHYGMISEDLTLGHIANTLLLAMAGYTMEQLTLAEEPADAWEAGAGDSSIRIWAGTTEVATTYKRVRSLRAGFVAPGGRIGPNEDVSWYNYRLQSKAFYHKGRSHCWLRHESTTQPSGVLAAYRERVSNLCQPMSEAFNFHSALQARTDQGLPDVVSSGADEYLWTTLRQEYAESFTVRVCLLDYNTIGLRPASLDRDRLFGGGMVHCFDGHQQDHGFFHAPEIISVTPNAGGGSLTLASTYQWLAIYEWTDRNGLWHASAPSVPVEDLLAGGENEATIRVRSLEAGEWYRNKDNVRIVIYRTLAGGSEFHYEGHIANDPEAFYVDFLSDDADTTIEDNRLAYTDGSAGSAVENTCPPPMTQIIKHKDRLLGISEEDPREVWFTKPQAAGVAAEFSIYQVHRLPVSGVGLASMGEHWIAFTEDNRIYAVAGEGPDVFGVAGEFTQPRLISRGTELINPRFLAETDIGILFQSERGIETLPPGGQPATISDPVESEFYVGQDLARCVPDPANSRIYVAGLSDSGLMLVYDYKHDRWTTLTARGTYQRDATLHQGVLHTLHKDGKIRKAAGYQIDGSAIVSMKLETPWIKAGNLTGFQRIWWVNILGGYLGPHTLRITHYVDYDGLVVVGSKDFVITSQADGHPYHFRWKPARQKCAAAKFVLEDLVQSGSYKSASWAALELTCGYKGPLPKRSKNIG